ncbi:MAG: hypothetical protein HQM03_22235 [Magnetococcales bacterium]|nr:hypothetical protein [Magnetococcales bacterium]MBF0182740.1 hypothetical protein [Magnetococcales bacterium]
MTLPLMRAGPFQQIVGAGLPQEDALTPLFCVSYLSKLVLNWKLDAMSGYWHLGTLYAVAALNGTLGGGADNHPVPSLNATSNNNLLVPWQPGLTYPDDWPAQVWNWDGWLGERGWWSDSWNLTERSGAYPWVYRWSVYGNAAEPAIKNLGIRPLNRQHILPTITEGPAMSDGQNNYGIMETINTSDLFTLEDCPSLKKRFRDLGVSTGREVIFSLGNFDRNPDCGGLVVRILHSCTVKNGMATLLGWRIPVPVASFPLTGSLPFVKARKTRKGWGYTNLYNAQVLKKNTLEVLGTYPA